MSAHYSRYAEACANGYEFAMPMNDSEAIELNAVIDKLPGDVRMWVPINDIKAESKINLFF